MNKFDSNEVFNKPTLINIVKSLWEKDEWEYVANTGDLVKRKDSPLRFWLDCGGVAFHGQKWGNTIYWADSFSWFIILPLTWRIKWALNKKSK